MKRIQLAIVGSTKVPDNEAVRQFVWDTLKAQGPPSIVDVISGGAKGMDSIAAKVADGMGYDVYEILPKVKRWGGPAGYQARNAVIAERCTTLIRVGHYESKTYGSGWTRDYATVIGKPTFSYKYIASGDIIRDFDDLPDWDERVKRFAAFAMKRSVKMLRPHE